MNKQIKMTLIFVVVLFLSLLLQQNISSAAVFENLTVMPYTQEYQDWLALPEKERNNTIAPSMYDIKITNVSKNTINSNNILKGSASLPAKYDLRKYIKIPVKNQLTTNTCWAFASNTSLETNILLKRALTYDFSEKYLEYATARQYSFSNSINNMRI